MVPSGDTVKQKWVLCMWCGKRVDFEGDTYVQGSLPVQSAALERPHLSKYGT